VDADVASRVSFELHRRWLRRHQVRGRVLEIGAGPGRFTVELVRSGCRVVVADISAVQLDLNRQHVAAAGATDGVEHWERADICDLPAAWQGGFDAVVANGGLLSYVFDDATTAADQCLQALTDGGVFVGSVMSLAGNARLHSAAILDLASGGHRPAVDELLRTGDQRAIGASGASNWFTADGTAVAAAHPSEQLWDWLLDAEEAMGREPGTVEGGSHMLFAAGRGARRDRGG
jgi:SAM-dependent methyltransferase